MRVLFVWALLAALTVGVVSPIVYIGWNLALAPWLGWREMPASVALVVGFILALLTARVRER